MKLEDLRRQLGLMSDEDLMNRVKEIRSRRRAPAKTPGRRKASNYKPKVSTKLKNLSADELTKLLNMLKSEEK